MAGLLSLDLMGTGDLGDILAVLQKPIEGPMLWMEAI